MPVFSALRVSAIWGGNRALFLVVFALGVPSVVTNAVRWLKHARMSQLISASVLLKYVTAHFIYHFNANGECSITDGLNDHINFMYVIPHEA